MISKKIEYNKVVCQIGDYPECPNCKCSVFGNNYLLNENFKIIEDDNIDDSVYAYVCSGCHIMFSYGCEYSRTNWGDTVCWPIVITSFTNVENNETIGSPIFETKESLEHFLKKYKFKFKCICTKCT